MKAQLRAAALALGYPDGHWRIRAAWNGEAGSWSAAAFAELKEKYNEWAVRQERRKSTDKARLALLCATLAQKLSDADPHFRRAEIAELVNAARALGGVAR